jgi:hypothetical protein
MQVDELIGQLQTFAAGAEHGRTDVFREAAQQVADELVALQSIFGNESIALLSSRNSQTSSPGASTWCPEESIRLCITVPIDLADDDEALSIRLSATLPSGYPQTSSPPQIQLLSKYVGSHGVDHLLFGQVLRIFYQSTDVNDHVVFQQGEVALFDGIERVREKVEVWYSKREASQLHTKKDDESHSKAQQGEEDLESRVDERVEERPPSKAGKESSGIEVFSSPAISERKSTFIGHAAVLTNLSQVALILEDVMKDKKVARASHPTIYAWVCRPEADGPIHRDCDDDGETAAGGRLAHLLDLLHLENVMVVVTRWYGGVHLGADRFKMINRAARDALEVAQMVAGPLNPNSTDLKNGNHSKR